MPFYTVLKQEQALVQQRAVAGLLALKQQLAASVPRRTVADTLLLATWNIREFDSEKYGPRCAECFYYIAEILDHFDLIAIQEVHADLWALQKLLDLLGGWWKYLVTDVTEGRAGNRERLAFVYDSRKVIFDGLAGEIVLPEVQGERALQLARTPFLCGFKAGWSKFSLCTVHIYYGDDTPNEPRRVQEIQSLAQLLARRTKPPTAMSRQAPENLIVLGDFNIYKSADLTYKALTDAGFTIPPDIQPLAGSNLDRSKHYDQIAFMAQPFRFGTTGRAGVFDYYQSVFHRDDDATYADLLPPAYKDSKNPKRYYNEWRTYQMSDHLLLWVELQTNFSQEYLQSLQAPVVEEVPARVLAPAAAGRRRAAPQAPSGRSPRRTTSDAS